MTSLMYEIIINNTVLFIGTILLGLLMTAFPEVLEQGNFKKLKKFFF